MIDAGSRRFHAARRELDVRVVYSSSDPAPLNRVVSEQFAAVGCSALRLGAVEADRGGDDGEREQGDRRRAHSGGASSMRGAWRRSQARRPEAAPIAAAELVAPSAHRAHTAAAYCVEDGRLAAAGHTPNRRIIVVGPGHGCGQKGAARRRGSSYVGRAIVQGRRASSTMFSGDSAARFTVPNPPATSTSARRAGPAWVPRPTPPGCDSEPGVQTSVENP